MQRPYTYHRNANRIIALLKSIETGDPEPIAVVNQQRYIQHNPQTHAGSEGLEELFKRLSLTKPRVNAVRAFEDGDYVFAHMEYDFSSRKICFEVFRFEEDQAVEHWDNIQPRLGPNVSGHSMVDGPVEAKDHGATTANRAAVHRFIQTVMIDNQLDRLSDFFATGCFIEHNPLMGDDMSALRCALTPGPSENRSIDYRRLHRVLAEGNFVLAVSEGLRAGVPSAFYDLFRLEQGLIIEHWDTTEAIAPRAQWKNDNGKF